MNDDTVHIPLALAVIVLSIASVLLISLAITCVFFDRNGHLRRFGRHASRALRVPNSATRGGTARRTPNRREPWGH